jgi:hypothetical protein
MACLQYLSTRRWSLQGCIQSASIERIPAILDGIQNPDILKGKFGVEAGEWGLRSCATERWCRLSQNPRNVMPSRQGSPENASNPALRRHITTSKLHPSGTRLSVRRIGTVLESQVEHNWQF